MSTKILTVVTGLVVWLTIVSVAGIIVRLSWPAYASVADAMKFTLPMLIARLSISVLATLAMGVVTAIIAPRSMIARLMPSLLLLLAFIPQHIWLWDKFPIWYHLSFLFSLVPLTYAGGMMWRGWKANRAVHVASAMKAGQYEYQAPLRRYPPPACQASQRRRRADLYVVGDGLDSAIRQAKRRPATSRSPSSEAPP